MAERKNNVGRTDRIIRALLTPIVFASAVWVYYSLPPEPLTWALIGLFGFLTLAFGVGAINGTCGLYAPFGINTCKDCEADYEGGDSWG